MTTIIAASDLTDRSQHVPGRAIDLATKLGARVLLVHVASPGAPALRNEDARRRMQAQLDEAPTPPGPDVEIRVVNGRPELVIPDIAAQEGAELLILGLHRVRPVLDLLRLTTLERIVLRATPPVLIAHTPASRPYRTVLAATDFSPACAAALAAAARLAPDATFHAIHALQLPLMEKLGPHDVENSSAMIQASPCAMRFCECRRCRRA
jgi:nucleotide-binding universal stress UspA family protein